MIEQICAYIHNYFEHTSASGTFTIENGVLVDGPGIMPGQYFHIRGSVFNDGVHLISDQLTDETFTGTITLMAVPKAVLELSEDISAWVEQNAQVMNSPYQSESFGGYSYTKASGSGGADGADWRSVFSTRLNQWRKLSC